MYAGHYITGGVDCPVCGEAHVAQLYFNGWDECAGCDCCVVEKEADEYLDDLINGRVDREVDESIAERCFGPD